MIDVARVGQLLIVSDGPGRLYKCATWSWPALTLATLSVGALPGVRASLERAASAPFAEPWTLRSAFVVVALLVMLALLRGWRTTAHRFDRAAGTLVIAQSGLVRAKVQRDLSLATVSAVVDRRSAKARAIELVLADHSTLVVARTDPGSRALDSVARELSDLLQKPLRLARGVVVDQRFEIDRFVDPGGMGVVYRALDRASGQPVALKLAQLAFDTGPAQQRFVRELGLLAALDHPRIARHVSHGSSADGTAYLAVQWLEGEDLRTRLTRGPLSLDESLSVLSCAAEALAVVHGKGIVHGALKPANLFLREHSAADLVLLDFGIARRFDRTTGLTDSRALLGTPHYLAPEQASSASDLGPEADVFSLGCIFYECLTGRQPFDAKQLLGVLARILFDRAEPVESVRPSVPEPWLRLLERMLAKDPALRPADGGALHEELCALPAASAAEDAPVPSTLRSRARGRASTLQAREAGDQVLVTVVLATLGAAPQEARASPLAPRWAAGDAAPPFVQASLARPTRARFDLREALQHSCPIERLADGSLLATVRARHSEREQARIAARCALYLRELLPEARLSVATGHASHWRPSGVGEAVDRALVLDAQVVQVPAASLGASTLREPRVDPGGIRLDALTASLLDARFVTARVFACAPEPGALVYHDEIVLLAGETPELDESRPLLGKPTPCVGRERELVQLEGPLASADADALPRAAAVLGAPGIGKSRLRHELSRRLRERYPAALLLVGHGDPRNAGSPYVVLAAALRRHAGIHAGDASASAQSAIREQLCKHVERAQHQRVSEFLGELCGVPFPAQDSPPLLAARGDPRVMSEQISAAFVDWLAAECAAHPVVFTLEDVQWADALSCKLLERSLRELERARLYVLAFGRPEAESVLPRLFAGQHPLSLSLGPLSDRASEALVRELLASAQLEREQVQGIVRLAAGNPLFLEELIRTAQCAFVDGKAGDVPDTVLSLLQARLSRLAPEERSILRAASVFGQRFWPAGVQRIGACLGSLVDAEPWLVRLVDAELVVRGRTSSSAGEVEYSFRHALVCDAAYGLLSAVDREAAHAAAGHWLERHGETDSVVLARHAEASGDRQRALVFYTRAAEHSLAQYDFGEALTRAQKGVACGAFGASLGILEYVQCAAFYRLGRPTEAATLGLRALTLVTRGDSRWCSAVEMLIQVLPNLGRLEKSRELADELLLVVPEPEARAAYARALHAQLLCHALSGAHAASQRCLDALARLGREVLESDLSSRGNARLWRSVYTFFLTRDMELALSLVEQAIVDLTESQVRYRLSCAHSVSSFILWGLGDLPASERAARTGRDLARQLNDGYHDALAAWFLSLALSEQTDPGKLEQAEQCARTLQECADHAYFDACSRHVVARVALVRGAFARAECEAREAYSGQHTMLPYRLLASASLLHALTAQRRWDEAALLARQALQQLLELEGPVFCETMVRVAAVEALLGAGHTVEAEGVLAETVAQIEQRAQRILSPTRKASYLARPENRGAALLAQAAKTRV